MTNKSSLRTVDEGTVCQLDENVKLLVQKRDELRTELNSSQQLNQLLKKLISVKQVTKLNAVNTLLQKVVKTDANYTNEALGYGLGSDGSEDATKDFKVSYKAATGKRLMVCRGCAKNFTSKGLYQEFTAKARVQAYTRHCIKECDKYKALGLIGHCFECKMSFITKASRTLHFNKFHGNQSKTKPGWMTNGLFKSNFGRRPYNALVNCKGCYKTFEASEYLTSNKNTKKVRPEFDYYVHCIEQCKGYKKLRLIQECKLCHMKFLDSKSMAHHNCTHTAVNTKKIRSWMSQRVVKKSNSKVFNSTINCKGCGKLFEAQTYGTSSNAELDYYIHCVEECDDYKKLNLIQKCQQCKKLFLNKASFSQHRKACT